VIRALTLLGAASFIAAIALLIADPGGNAVLAIVLIIASLMISGFLTVRAIYFKAQTVAGDARAFAAGNVQQARLVEIGDPRGFLSPEATITLELEGEDAKRHRIERDVPVPFPLAWGYRLGKRFNLPYLRDADLTDLMAFELRREGLDVDLGRGSRTEAGKPAD
jgi:hypothetical protein